MKAKTDNAHVTHKLDLRRYFLRKFHSEDPIHVLDCCQGDGVLWRTLRAEFPVASYWGVDVKKKSGRLKIDSVRILQQSGITQNVIDVDTYGAPWSHWSAIVQRVTRPLTVFLTIGHVAFSGSFSDESAAAMGCTFKTARMPTCFGRILSPLGVQFQFDLPRQHGARIVEAVEAIAPGDTRYVGIRLTPGKSMITTPAAPDPEHKTAVSV